MTLSTPTALPCLPQPAPCTHLGFGNKFAPVEFIVSLRSVVLPLLSSKLED